MASLIPTFELISFGSGVTATKDDWFDIGTFGPNTFSPIPSGKQLWLGFATFIAEDKQLIFELRPNIAGQSTGTIGNTQLREFISVQAGESGELDMFLGGQIVTLAPVLGGSTGVEKLWLRVRSGTNVVAVWNYILYYTIY